jgi:hypothetical protein
MSVEIYIPWAQLRYLGFIDDDKWCKGGKCLEPVYVRKSKFGKRIKTTNNHHDGVPKGQGRPAWGAKYFLTDDPGQKTILLIAGLEKGQYTVYLTDHYGEDFDGQHFITESYRIFDHGHEAPSKFMDGIPWGRSSKGVSQYGNDISKQALVVQDVANRGGCTPTGFVDTGITPVNEWEIGYLETLQAKCSSGESVQLRDRPVAVEDREAAIQQLGATSNINRSKYEWVKEITPSFLKSVSKIWLDNDLKLTEKFCSDLMFKIFHRLAKHGWKLYLGKSSSAALGSHDIYTDSKSVVLHYSLLDVEEDPAWQHFINGAEKEGGLNLDNQPGFRSSWERSQPPKGPPPTELPPSGPPRDWVTNQIITPTRAGHPPPWEDGTYLTVEESLEDMQQSVRELYEFIEYRGPYLQSGWLFFHYIKKSAIIVAQHIEGAKASSRSRGFFMKLPDDKIIKNDILIKLSDVDYSTDFNSFGGAAAFFATQISGYFPNHMRWDQALRYGRFMIGDVPVGDNNDAKIHASRRIWHDYLNSFTSFPDWYSSESAYKYMSNHPIPKTVHFEKIIPEWEAEYLSLINYVDELFDFAENDKINSARNINDEPFTTQWTVDVDSIPPDSAISGYWRIATGRVLGWKPPLHPTYISWRLIPKTGVDRNDYSEMNSFAPYSTKLQPGTLRNVEQRISWSEACRDGRCPFYEKEKWDPILGKKISI